MSEETKSPKASGVDKACMHQTDSSLLEAYRYIGSVPGKDVRGTLIDCFQLWFHVGNPEILTEVRHQREAHRG